MNKFLFIVLVDIFLTGMDILEAYEKGYIEEWYEEPYEIGSDDDYPWVKKFIEKGIQ